MIPPPLPRLTAPPLPIYAPRTHLLSNTAPHPTKTPFGYQETAAAELAGKWRYGLHDEMGVGKTGTVIRAMDLAKQVRGWLVVPAMIRENWVKELRAFATVERRVVKLMTVHDYVAWERGRFDTIIMSYEAATKYARRLVEKQEVVDFIHMDEAHYLKNDKAARSRELLGRYSDGSYAALTWAKSSFHVTGTVMPNDPIDIFTFLKFARVMPLSKGEFIERYLEPHGASLTRFKVKKHSAAELQAIVDSVSISRSMDDVGLQIPPIHLSEVVIEGDTSEITKMLLEHPDLEQAIIDAVNLGGLKFMEAQHVETLRRLISKAKSIPYSTMLVDELSYSSYKQVVYGIHKDALMLIAARAQNAGIGTVVVTGDTSERQRIEAVERFQEDPSIRLFVGNMKAAGVGITLTASHRVDVFENNWSPVDVAQAIKRVHRVGQDQIVRARFTTLAGTIDEDVNKIVKEKAAEIAKVERRAMVVSPT